MLAGCEDASIVSHVDSSSALSKGRIMSMAQRGAIPLEVHGAPWSGATAAQVAQNFRFPQDFPPEIQLRAVAPGETPRREPSKLVLIFNSSNPPDSRYACDMTAPAAVNAPPDKGFKAHLVFCGSSGAIGEGRVHVRQQIARNWPEFTREMRVLMKRIFNHWTNEDER